MNTAAVPVAPMAARDVAGLLVLSVLWGAAYLFMRSAVSHFGPAGLIAVRMLLASLMLLPLLLWRGKVKELGARPGALLVLAVPLTAFPFLMLGFAAQHLSAGMLAVLNATAPLFAGLLAHFVFKERLGPWRAAGLGLGFFGVGVLAWGGAAFKSVHGLLAVAAVLFTSMLWAVGANFTKRKLAGMDSLVLTVGSLALAGLSLAPLAAATWPQAPVPARAWFEMAFLGLASSGLGFLLYFRLLRRIGPVRTMSVTFLNPVVAVVSGALYLGEAFTLQMLLGGAVVLLGTALSLGLIGPGPNKG